MSYQIDLFPLHLSGERFILDINSLDCRNGGGTSLNQLKCLGVLFQSLSHINEFISRTLANPSFISNKQSGWLLVQRIAIGRL